MSRFLKFFVLTAAEKRGKMAVGPPRVRHCRDGRTGLAVWPGRFWLSSWELPVRTDRRQLPAVKAGRGGHPS